MPYDEISAAERDLRTSALNSSTTIKLLNQIRAQLEAANPRPPPSGFAHPGEFLAAIRRQKVEHVEDPRLFTNAVTTYAGEQVQADGGFALPSEFVPEVLLPVVGSGSLLSVFDPVPTRSDILRVAVDEEAEWGTAGVTANHTAEGAAVTPSKPVLKPVNCALHRVPAFVHSSEELIGRSTGFQRYVWKTLGRKIRNRVEALIVAGNGLNEPLGLLYGPAVVTVAKESSQTAATIVAANVGKMAARLLAGSFPTSIWIAHSSALPQIMALGTIYNANGPSPFGYGTLLGRPLAVSEYANPLGSLGDLILTDPMGYLYGLDGPQQAATIEFAFDQSLDSFRASVYMGGAPLLSTPVPRRTGTDTLSHCVVLEARA